MRFISLMVFVGLLITGCASSENGGLLNRQEVLAQNPNADIIEYDGKIYKHGVDWIEKESLTKNKKIAEVSGDMATKLPEGTKIFSTNEKKYILIAEYDGKEKRYLLQAGE